MSKHGTAYLKFTRCSECTLKGRPVVPGYGNTDHPFIAFVAEAPGETEVEQGVPLVGRSGQLLHRVLQDIGIDEDMCYYTNACLCNPNANATPTPRMIKACKTRLVRELVAIQPQIIVTLGKMSTMVLTDHKNMRNGHGVYREIALHGGGDWEGGVLPTYHPAAVLRGPELFKDFVDELSLAKSIVEGSPAVIQPPYQNYVYITTQDQFDWLVAELPKHSLVAVDIEADKLECNEARLLCIGFSWAREHAWILDGELLEHHLDNTRRLNEALKDLRLALQNGIFDIPFMRYHGLTNAFYYFDTMQAHYLIDERQNTHGLERLAIRYYRAPDYKSAFRRAIGVKSFVADELFANAIAGAPKEQLFDYNGADVDYTYRLARDLIIEVEKQGQLPVFRDVEMPSCRTFAEFTEYGMLIDRDYLEEMGQAWVTEENELVEKMREASGDPNFNPGSRKQLAHYLYDVLELEPFGGRGQLESGRIDEGVISKFINTVEDPEAREYWTSRRTVMNSGLKGFGGVAKGISPRSTAVYMLYWLRQQHEFPNWVIRWSYLRKRRSLYYDGTKKWIDKAGRIHPKYDMTATRTGRKSTGRPAVHNIPRGDLIYNMFIAEPGWCMIHADYAQAEMRMMAHYSGDEDLMVLLETTDIHTRMAMQIFHLTEKQIAEMPKAELSDKRIAAKMVTFGLPYGRTAAGLAPQLGITVQEAQTYIDDYFKLVPGLHRWLKLQRKKGIEEQQITSVFGRRRRFPLIADQFHRREVERQGGNMAIQSAINDLTLVAYNNSLAALRKNNIPVHPGPHIHDSINFVVPKPFWRAAVKIIMETMIYVPFKTKVKFPATCEIGERWGGMITVFDKGKWITPDLDAPEWIRRGFREGLE